MAAVEEQKPIGSFRLTWNTVAGIALVSVVYFADIFLKAHYKCFWLDELFTTYLCRLPSFESTWHAVLRGADFNPPLLYLFTRAAQSFFGEGLIATRLPAMVGVWTFGVCLFFFVSRRAGVISGFVAGTFPFFTLAQYYAYEARAHGIVLGWCGLALICWQKIPDARAKNVWVVGFGLCLLGALLTHVYAVYLLFPFGLVELYSLLKGRGMNWGIVADMAAALVFAALVVYLPLFRMYRASVPATFRPSSHDLVQHFLVTVIGPAMGILLFAMILLAVEGRSSTQRSMSFAAIPEREMWLAIGFVCIPLLGLIGCKFSHGPFLDRYFLSSITGYAIFLGFSCSRWRPGSWTANILAGCIFLFMVADLGSTIYLAMKQRIVLTEPSSGIVLGTTPWDPMRRYETVVRSQKGLDILVIPELEYIYLFNYAPPAVKSHLYFGAPANSLFLSAYERLANEAHLDLKLTTLGPFLATHDRFLLYESGDPLPIEVLQAIARGGYRLRAAQADAAGTMSEYTK